MDIKQEIKRWVDVGQRMDWTAKHVRLIPSEEIERLAKQYEQLVPVGYRNQNVQGEYMINEYSMTKTGELKLYKPDRIRAIHNHVTGANTFNINKKKSIRQT